MTDTEKIIKAGIISKAMSGRYLNTRRLLRDLENVEEHFDKGDKAADVAKMLKTFMTTSEKSNKVLEAMAERLDALENANTGS